MGTRECPDCGHRPGAGLWPALALLALACALWLAAQWPRLAALAAHGGGDG